MSRVILILVLVIVLGITLIGAMLYFAYGVADRPPEEIVIEGLVDSTTIVMFDNGSASIEASSREGAMTALGYLHGQEHMWSMALWRHTASGRLSEWFGDRVLPLDRLTRRLALASLARQAYDRLDPDEQSMLSAYARGVNAARDLEEVRLANEFVALATIPEPWEPWHALAIERLFAWLAAERPNPDSLAMASDEVRDFFDTDDLLRRWLHLHGFEHSMAWTARDSVGTRLVTRQIYGASALPIFAEVQISWPGAPPLTGASLIGTPFIPAGKTETAAWTILLSGTIDLVPVERDSAAAPVVYERIESADGREHLLEVRRTPGEIFFGGRNSFGDRDPLSRPDRRPSISGTDRDTSMAPTPPPQAGWALTWSGLEAVSDVSAWGALIDGMRENFQLIDASGIILQPDGTTAVIGDPRVSITLETGRLIANSDWSAYSAYRLDSLTSTSEPLPPIPNVIDDARSAWAARLAPPLTDAAIAVPEQPHLVTEALAYLRNWDFTYERASIAASIFDTWMLVYRDSLDRLPDPEVPDTMLGENLVRYETLLKAVELLVRRAGEDPSQWRWELIQPHRYSYPVWSADSMLGDAIGSLTRTRYAPIVLPGSGHPTTLRFGPSSLERGPDSPAVWEAWISTEDWDEFSFRRRSFEANRFFGRYLVSDRIPDPTTIPSADARAFSVTLLPR